MPALFERTEIGPLSLDNRAVRSATWSGVGDERGYVTDLAVKFYGDLAKGGIGLIITGYQYIMRNAMQLPYMIGNYDDDQIAGLARLADAVHSEGGKVIPQIVHCGSRANPALFPEGEEVWAPSAIPDTGSGTVPHEITNQDIQRLVEAYAAAALRSFKAGFDGVQLHGAHGYGINQFLSPAWNRRGDAYGGSLKNRYRFVAEVMEAVRAAVGEDFPIFIKLSVHDFVERGLVPEESVEVARRLADDGIFAIEVSGGSADSPTELGPVRRRILKDEDEAYFSHLSAAVKGAVGVPVITVGGVRSLNTIQQILDDRKADYVAMSRPFIREPDLINRWKSGDTARASCIACNGCFETGLTGKGISCKVKRALAEKARE
jgi:2,4-dienoyl-CoA reductase-like NADH-dependent reductase (Old Yellow Enzyme family)